ncbi:tRNA-specific adenosine deaminase TAD3 isoform X2 [Cornus florida]|uniref:tRNA-specific adenosine deaminase TAD3 isoform X2 n=1 Tax=Cornus florida TaxID=4283 RepID=UPI0028968FE4|nr:tRNA-specific adenosine deaminase TAD3 isoform X2 [Cornus florida]
MNVMNNTDWEIIHIPDNPPDSLHHQSTVDVFACDIEPKIANTLVRKLNQICPLENLRHVKRVRKKCLQGGKTQLSVILCLTSESDNQRDSMPDDVVKLINSYQLNVFITQVCKYAASSNEEWKEKCKLWPISYHPPTYNIDGITGFNEEDSQSILSFMMFSIDLAKSGDCQVGNAAVIVDPSVKGVIASARDQIHSWNTPMNKTIVETSCLEKPEVFTSCPVSNGVASHNTLLSNCLSEGREQLYTSVSCLYPWQWAEQQLHLDSCYRHPLRHAAIIAIEYSAARDRRLFPGLEHIGDKSFQVDHLSSPAGSPAKRQKPNHANVEDEENVDTEGFSSKIARPYLCTGYDIYLVWEPCPIFQAWEIIMHLEAISSKWLVG